MVRSIGQSLPSSLRLAVFLINDIYSVFAYASIEIK